MTTLTIIFIITTALSLVCLLLHVFFASHKREELIRYYENQKNERFEQELQEAKMQWQKDNLRMKEEFNQIIEKKLEPIKNLKDKIDRQ